MAILLSSLRGCWRYLPSSSNDRGHRSGQVGNETMGRSRSRNAAWNWSPVAVWKLGQKVISERQSDFKDQIRHSEIIRTWIRFYLAMAQNYQPPEWMVFLHMIRNLWVMDGTLILSHESDSGLEFWPPPCGNGSKPILHGGINVLMWYLLVNLLMFPLKNLKNSAVKNHPSREVHSLGLRWYDGECKGYWNW